MPSVDRPDATLWWDERGDGEPVLLVHGGLFDPMTGERFWLTPGVADDLAAAGFRVLTPDRRFSPGRTTADFATHTWDTEADDLAAILDAAGVERAHVIAGSNGCSAATRLALRHPTRVSALVLCWPATPTTAAIQASFEWSADAVDRDGTAAYLNTLRRDGVPRPGEERPGFPFGFALLHDRRTANSFLDHTDADAAQAFRDSAAALLPGDLIRGLTRDDCSRLDSSGIPIHIMPAEPEDPYHLRSTAHALRDAIPGATQVNGFPITPSRFFADVREEFANELQRLMRLDDHR